MTEYTEGNSKNEQDVISIRELLIKLKDIYSYLLSKWVLLLIFGIIGAGLGFLYASWKAPIYTATTTFVLEEGSGGGGLGGLGGLASMAGIDLGADGGGLFQGDNILELYKSRSMIEKTLLSRVDSNNKKDLLIDYYIEFNHLKKGWEKNKELLNLKFSVEPNANETSYKRLRDSVMGSVVTDIKMNYLNVFKPDKKLSLIFAVVKAKNEFFAKAFNDQIVKNVNDFYVQTKTKKSLENVAILQRKTDSVRSVMNGAIYRAASVIDATPNLNASRGAQRAAPMQSSQFSAETNKAILTVIVQNLEMSKMSLLKEKPLIQVVDQPIYPLDKVAFGKLKGIVVGGFMFSFLTACFLLVRRLFLSLM